MSELGSTTPLTPVEAVDPNSKSSSVVYEEGLNSLFFGSIEFFAPSLIWFVVDVKLST